MLSFSEKSFQSDSSGVRSKSECRNPVYQQVSPPTQTATRISRAKALIIPPFSYAGRRMRRPSSTDQGPIQIKLGRTDSTKSIEATDSSPKVFILV